MKKSVDIDRLAVMLITKFGDDSAEVALLRSRCCAARQDRTWEILWQRVMQRVIEFHFCTGAGKTRH